MLEDFLKKAATDPRLSPVHISLYVRLWYLNNQRGRGQGLSFFSHEVKTQSKIISDVTYHKAIRGLHDFGYIAYTPSFNHSKGSVIKFL